MSTRILHSTHGSSRRRAATVVLVVVILPVLLGTAALTLDVAVLMNTRADLQNAADAAAMAGASALALDAMLSVRDGTDRGDITLVELAVAERIHAISPLNHSLGGGGMIVESGDITLGWIDVESATSPILAGADPATYNAVRVLTRRDAESANGPVELFFSPVFGHLVSNVSASATAVFDDRFSGYEANSSGPGVLPVTVDIDEYNRQVSFGVDRFAWDSAAESVTAGTDEVNEILVFPDVAAPGNFGLLNIGIENMGIPELALQIENGVTPGDFELEIGTSEVSFFNDAGEPITHEITGNPGLKTSLEPALSTLVGQVIAFFVHDQVDLGGANAVYRVVGMRFGRVMEAVTKAGVVDKGVYVQPVTFHGAGVRTNLNAPSSGGAAGQIVLAR